MKLKYRIAELNIEMDTFGKTLRLAEPYRCDFDGPPDGSVFSVWNENRKRAALLTVDEYEYLFTGFSFGELLMKNGGNVLHASAVVMDGKAYCFSADSGVGKSTHTRLYQERFGQERALLLNDDKPAIRRRGDTWRAYGMPWSGKDGLNINASYPLGGICFLAQGPENCIGRATDKEAVRLLMRQFQLPKSMPLRVKALEVIDAVIRSVPIWTMTCNLSPEAAEISYAAMSGKGE